MSLGEGLEPTTFGLSVPALCGARKLSGAPPAHFPAIFRPRQFQFLPLPATGGGRHKNPMSHARRAHNQGVAVQIFPVSEELENRKCDFRVLWLREKDLNLRPSGYEPDELPTAPSRDILSTSSLVLNYYITYCARCQAFSEKSFLPFSTFFFYKTASQLFIKSYALKYFSSRGIHFSA